MVEHAHPDRPVFWTLPGGAIDGDETAEEAAVRELREETGLRGRPVRVLFDGEYSGGSDICVLVEVVDDGAMILGHDPELEPDEQILTDIAWRPLREMREDVQVKRVIEALNLEV